MNESVNRSIDQSIDRSNTNWPTNQKMLGERTYDDMAWKKVLPEDCRGKKNCREAPKRLLGGRPYEATRGYQG